ncbi:MAG: aminopeptidase P family protein [Ignavibacteriae bacterium]|nr:aminopeptidase P family protein [Ignavibacteriota bacterium]MCB9242820.1 aminopeptidase P family protein [Ignavibacteriales bacterium]
MTRIESIRKSFKKHGIDALLVTNLTGIKYLTGFLGSAAVVLITKKNAYFITDFRYKTVVKDGLPSDYEVMISKQSSFEFLKKLIKKNKLKKIGFEATTLNYNAYLDLKENYKAKFVPVAGLVESVSAIKEPYELDCLKKAIEISDKAFEHILAAIVPGKTTEKDLAADITYFQMKLGGERNSFDPIVAGGENSALPHAHPTDRVIQYGDLLTLDYGTVYKGFNSDMTRTVAIGQISDDKRRIYEIVKEAQRRAVEAIKAGMVCKTVDAVARDFIRENGYGDNFGHGLGHGLGYDVHEAPRLNQFSKYKLKVNNVVTVEPGIYVEGLGGVRIEDDVVVTDDGCEILNKTTKDLVVL